MPRKALDASRAWQQSRQGRCCRRRHFPSHVAVNVEGVWGKASLPQRTPVKQKATAIRDSTTNVRFCATVIRSSEKSVRSDAILYAELGEIPLEEVDREGAAGYFGSPPPLFVRTSTTCVRDLCDNHSRFGEVECQATRDLTLRGCGRIKLNTISDIGHVKVNTARGTVPGRKRVRIKWEGPA